MSTSTSAGKVKPVTRQELQNVLDAVDAALPEDVKRRFPIVDRSSIAKAYPDQWVAFFRTTVDENHRIVGGRVLAHAEKPEELEQMIRPIIAAYPDAHFFILRHYTGRDPMGDHFVRVRRTSDSPPKVPCRLECRGLDRRSNRLVAAPTRVG